MSDDVPSELHRIDVTGDGNCMYRALSVSICGVEQFFMEIRLAIAAHMLKHAERWKRLVIENFNRLSVDQLQVRK
jgi:hypothetical protein